MRWLPPLVLHGAHLVDDGHAGRARRAGQRLASWPERPEIADLAGLARRRTATCRPTRGRKAEPMEHGTPWILSSLVYLGAAVLAVPLARLLGLGSIIGYLGAGIAIGPWGLKLVTDAQDMLHFAEFGVVLMLFLVGLELEPRRLWALRRPIFGWGSVQLLGSAALITGVGMAAGADWRLALVAGLGLGLSSTAIGLGVLAERNLMATSAGQSVLSVALLQDIAAIPILAIVPLLASGSSADGGRAAGWARPRRWP
jgi:glutathione-regulated potassium-efflux system ancillary protein KefC